MASSCNVTPRNAQARVVLQTHRSLAHVSRATRKVFHYEAEHSSGHATYRCSYRNSLKIFVEERESGQTEVNGGREVLEWARIEHSEC